MMAVKVCEVIRFWNTVKIETKDLADGLSVECERKRSIWNKSKILELSNGGMRLLLRWGHSGRSGFKREDQKFLY